MICDHNVFRLSATVLILHILIYCVFFLFFVFLPYLYMFIFRTFSNIGEFISLN